MNSLLLRTAAQVIVPLQIALSLVLLLRGHNEPGGGFIGGLVCAAAFVLYGVAFDMDKARQLLRFNPVTLLGAGLLAATASGLFAVVADQPFLTGVWSRVAVDTVIAGPVKFGSPLLFDIGVFLVVVGSVTLMVFSMAEEDR